MADEQLSDLIMGERKFLHDISNQLVIAQGMGSFVLSALEREKGNDPDCKELIRIRKTVTAIDKMITMLRERREIVKGMMSEHA